MTTVSPMFLGAQGFSAEEAGVKAAVLHELRAAGFDVPQGFVLPPDVVVETVTDTELQDWVERIGGFPVAVRSSGAAEDLGDASFAGIYESYLSVADVPTLRQRIGDCRASARSERVTTYQAGSGQDVSPMSLSVLIQRQVDARTSGVAFTIDPLSGIEDFGVVEYSSGLGEQVVSGHVTGTQLTVRLRDGAVVKSAAGTETGELGTQDVAALVKLMIAVQAYRGRPQDIEWAVDTGGALWLLQARPITAISWRTDQGQYTDADFRDGGVSARICTPLMYSLYRNAFQSTMQRFFVALGLQAVADEPEWISMFYGRPYWNVEAVKSCFAKVPGWSEREFDEDLGVNKDYGQAGPLRVPVTAGAVLRALPVAAAVTRLRRQKLTEVARFVDEWQHEHAQWRDRLRGLDAVPDERFASELEDCLLEFHLTTERLYFSVIYNNTVLQSDFKKVLDDIDRATGGSSSVTDLMGGLADVSHMDMQRGIVELFRVCSAEGIDSAAADAQFARFLDRHGFHADIELELMCPRWSEDPDRVRAMIGAMLDSGIEPADPDVSFVGQCRRYQEAHSEVRKRLRGKPFARLRYGRAFERRLDEVRRYLVARERMRECSAQAYAIVRAYVVEAGSRLMARHALSRPDDVFMLSAAELVSLVRDSGEGHAILELLDTIAFQRAMYDGYRDFEPPHELGSGVETVSAAVSDNCLTGLGCSPGQVEGTARVVKSLQEIDRIVAGDILVAQYTDPGWTPALGLVAGVVTQVGGMLSHAAVISREYGIPAVLNVDRAMALIRSGQRVRIDGRAGTVELLDLPEAQVS